MKLVSTAQEKGYVLGLDKNLLTTPKMADIEQGIMIKVEQMVHKTNYGVDSRTAIAAATPKPLSAPRVVPFAFTQPLSI